MQALLLQRIGQGADNVLLSDQFGKGFGAPLTGENLSHGEALIRGIRILRIVRWPVAQQRARQPAVLPLLNT